MDRVNEGSAPCLGDILYIQWAARRRGRGSIGGGDWVGVLLMGLTMIFSGMMGSGFSSFSSGAWRRDRASAFIFLGPG